MARGWESKSVEEQQSLAQQPAQGKRGGEDNERAQVRRSLELQISRLEQQLADARHQRHRDMLESALKELRERLQALAASCAE